MVYDRLLQKVFLGKTTMMDKIFEIGKTECDYKLNETKTDSKLKYGFFLFIFFNF